MGMLPGGTAAAVAAVTVAVTVVASREASLLSPRTCGLCCIATMAAAGVHPFPAS